MMFALTVLRILLALLLAFVLCSAQKSFLKGLLIGSILGHKKGQLLQDKGEHKEVHHKEHYYPPPVEKEYIPVPVHEEPKFYPVYIVKECSKKYRIPEPVHHHHHDHSHSYGSFESNKMSDFDTGFDGYSAEAEEGYDGYAGAASSATVASASKYKGTLDGYTETGYESAPKTPKHRTGSSYKNEMNDNNVGLVLTVQKDYEPKY